MRRTLFLALGLLAAACAPAKRPPSGGGHSGGTAVDTACSPNALQCP